MKLKKLLMIVLFISIVLICSFNKKQVKASEIDTEKIYCNATIEDEFKDNEIINSSMREAIENYSGLLVCGAGNSGKDNDTDSRPCYPASYNLLNIISVGGLMIDDNDEEKILDTIKDNGQHIISHYGQTSVDLFAPGYEIVSTYYNGGYSKDSGTSYAAPFVTGLAAMILSIVPDLSISELKATILNNVTPMSILTNKCVTGGRLNAKAAVRNIHRHSYLEYAFETSLYHRAECSCGIILIEGHIFLNNPMGGKICIKCGWMTLSANLIVKKEDEEEY